MILLFFQTILFHAQQDNVSDLKIIKVKFGNNSGHRKLCDDSTIKNGAVAMEFEVLDEKEKAVYGDYIYAIITCANYYEYQGPNKIGFYLEISEKHQPWEGEIIVLNEALLQRNNNNKKFWMVDLYAHGILD